jgi:hypothetical protein
MPPSSDEFKNGIPVAKKKEKLSSSSPIQLISNIIKGLVMLFLEIVGYFFVYIKFMKNLVHIEDKTIFKGTLGID